MVKAERNPPLATCNTSGTSQACASSPNDYHECISQRPRKRPDLRIRVPTPGSLTGGAGSSSADRSSGRTDESRPRGIRVATPTCRKMSPRVGVALPQWCQGGGDEARNGVVATPSPVGVYDKLEHLFAMHSDSLGGRIRSAGCASSMDRDIGRKPVSTLPVDWSLKTQVRIVSNKDVSWCKENGRVECMALRCLSGTPSNGDQAVALAQSLLYYSYPPPTMGTQQGRGKVSPESAEMWESAFRSAYSTTRHCEDTALYVRCSKFVVLFLSGGTLSTNNVALVSSSTRRLRSFLDSDNVRFGMPLAPDSTSSVADHADESALVLDTPSSVHSLYTTLMNRRSTICGYETPQLVCSHAFLHGMVMKNSCVYKSTLDPDSGEQRHVVELKGCFLPHSLRALLEAIGSTAPFTAALTTDRLSLNIPRLCRTLKASPHISEALTSVVRVVSGPQNWVVTERSGERSCSS